MSKRIVLPPMVCSTLQEQKGGEEERDTHDDATRS